MLILVITKMEFEQIFSENGIKTFQIQRTIPWIFICSAILPGILVVFIFLLLIGSYLKYQKMYVLNTLIACILCSSFSLNTILILTVFNVSSLKSIKIDQRFSSLKYHQNVFVIFTMVLIHLAQIAEWKNPGLDYNTFEEFYFPSTPISAPSMLLIDFNGLMCLEMVQKMAKKIVVCCT